MNPIVAPVLKVAETVAIWLDPRRRELVILRKAVRAAKQIINILDKHGEFKDLSDARRLILRIHYEKQLNAWEDGIA
jgi:hypothetical protein